ncbi:MAG: O-antigen ligase family protein [Candidatus Acidiferrales bacterium]
MRSPPRFGGDFNSPEMLPPANMTSADALSMQSVGSSRRHFRPRSRRIGSPISWRIVTAGLTGAVSGAVIAFGGTEPASFAAVEILLFALSACALWIDTREGPRLWWRGPALLAAYLACDVVATRPAAYVAREQLLTVAACLCGFFLAALVARDSEMRGSIWAVLVALGIVEALYGLMQYTMDWQQVLAFKKVDYTAQATGSYINPNNYAGLLEMLLPIVFARALWEFEQWTENSRGSGRRAALWLRADNGPRFALFLFGTLLLTAAVLFSRSRAGIATAWAGTLLVASIWAVLRRSRSAAVTIVASLVALTLAAGAWIGFSPVLARYRSAGQDLPSRIAVWKDTAALIRTHPYWGTGPGSFENAYTRVQTSHLAARLNHAHDDYLEFAAEWGVPGAALLFALVGFALVRALRGLRRTARAADWFLLLGCCGAVFSLLLHALVDFNLHIPANALLFAVLLGLAATLSTGEANGSERRAARR